MANRGFVVHGKSKAIHLWKPVLLQHVIGQIATNHWAMSSCFSIMRNHSDRSALKSWCRIREILISVVVSIQLRCKMWYTLLRWQHIWSASQATLRLCRTSSALMRCPICTLSVFAIAAAVCLTWKKRGKYFLPGTLGFHSSNSNKSFHAKQLAHNETHSWVSVPEGTKWKN